MKKMYLIAGLVVLIISAGLIHHAGLTLIGSGNRFDENLSKIDLEQPAPGSIPTDMEESDAQQDLLLFYEMYDRMDQEYDPSRLLDGWKVVYSDALYDEKPRAVPFHPLGEEWAVEIDIGKSNNVLAYFTDYVGENPEYFNSQRLVVEQFPEEQILLDMDFITPDRYMWWNSHAERVEWSPDGRFLAFSGLRSPGRYEAWIYEKATGDLKLFRTVENELHIMGWSPDSSTLVYEEAVDGIPLGESEMDTALSELWSYHMEGQRRTMLVPASEDFYGFTISWYDTNNILAGSLDMQGTADMRLVHIHTGESRLLLDGVYRQQAVDPETGMILIEILFLNGKYVFSNYYLLDPVSGVLMDLHIETGSRLQITFNESLRRAAAVGMCEDGGLGLYDRYGQVSCVETPGVVSPDGSWQVRTCSGTGILLQNIATEEIHTLFSDPDRASIGSALWREDSEGFVVTVGSDLYFLDVDSQLWQRINHQAAAVRRYFWLNSYFPDRE